MQDEISSVEPKADASADIDSFLTKGAPAGGAVVAVAFSEDLKAQEAMLACMRLQKHGRLDIDDAVIAIKVAPDKIRLVQTKDVGAPQAAISGSWWGLMAGLFVGGPLVGLALGAAVGGIWGKMRDIGIDDDEMRRIGESLEVGHAALFLLITDGHPSHAVWEATRFEGRLLVSTLGEDLNARLRESLAKTVNPWGA
ncbi:MAG: putative membrane protein [Glaciecola sp.]|jgi:uncharacterized membrane protein